MSEEFEMAKAITKTYAEGMKQGGRLCLPTLERLLPLIDKSERADFSDTGQSCHAELMEMRGLVEAEIRRIKGLPF